MSPNFESHFECDFDGVCYATDIGSKGPVEPCIFIKMVYECVRKPAAAGALLPAEPALETTKMT